MATCKPSEMTYTCEICGLEGFNDEEMRSHMVLYHLQGAASCPFCDLGEISPAEMLVHVNSAHLDYLTPSTPENDMMAFIDDDSLMDDSIKEEESQDLSSSSSSLFTRPHMLNGWSESSARNGESSSCNNKSSSSNDSPKNHTSTSNECPMCPFSSDNPSKLEEHINRQHFDLTSPSFPPESPPTRDGSYNCPLCVTSFPNPSDLELHVNIEHKDILSPAKGTTSTPEVSSNEPPACPVCLSTSFRTNEELTVHIEEHFAKKSSTPSPIDVADSSLTSSDRMLARDMERREKEVRKLREQREFEMLRAQYGMDNQGNFREQSVTNMQRAVYAGEMSVADYYERQIELKAAENNGIDDGSSCTRGLVSRVRAVSQACHNVINTWMCSTVDHYASTYGDKGWGCGYRNTQMLISSLLQHTGFNELVYRAWSSVAAGSTANPMRSSMPSISRLQRMIEWAWSLGFDVQGAEQLGGKLVNTRKWIGATEVVTLLSSLRIRCQLVDFHRPTSPDGSHPEMFQWVLQYFQKNDEFKPPLYLQHQGHSRTIMGVEQLRDGSITMLVLDPSHTPVQMGQFNSTSSAPGAMRLIRKSTAAMKARQYQIVAVVGTMENESRYQMSKVLRTTRIPQDR
ncbi:hypothetical protein G9C98_008138 [Cotesia typhae]|uniref:Zinc finger-containing ubiquitin peptidase 1 n=1 Tax=Cotesia typhae TaxID=2053667 RepID=A0A8J5UVN6_9HYME|nr:hypothetical protein G9C98_008138 [Cotesia typhae]